MTNYNKTSFLHSMDLICHKTTPTQERPHINMDGIGDLGSFLLEFGNQS